jgi:peptidoglycan hydrolase-like protein with peptidoglycan-binding domain
VGVYIGGGQVIEANSTAKGVIQTPLKGTGATAWSNWFYVPGVDYSGAAVTKPTIAPKPPAPAKPAVKIPITIKKGKKGFVVRQLQTLLNENGAKLAVDGDFGKLTDTEVRAYQKKNGLVVDGIVGVKTWGALLK